MTPEQKRWIDEASLEALLHKWRFAPTGDPYFQGQAGEHFSTTLFAFQKKDPDAWAAASKAVGWGTPVD